MVATLGQQYNPGEKPTVILHTYTYINRHAGLFLTFSVLVANPKKLLDTVANPARGLLNRERRTKEKSLAPHIHSNHTSNRINISSLRHSSRFKIDFFFFGYSSARKIQIFPINLFIVAALFRLVKKNNTLLLCKCCFSHSAYWLPTRKKLLYTVAIPARGLLNRKKNNLAAYAPPPPHPSR